MGNADMPAMPLAGDAYRDFAGYDDTKNTSYNPECQGLTKREYFAGLAMQGLVANGVIDPEMYGSRRIADLAVQSADALLDRLQRND